MNPSQELEHRVAARRDAWGPSTAASLAGHLLFFALLLGNAHEPSPLPPVIEVAVISPPAAKAAAIQRLTRAPAPPPPAPASQPTATPSPALPTPAEPTPAAPDTSGATDARRALLDQIERERLLEQIANAAEGAQDRDATRPDAVHNGGLGSSATGDPAFSRWQADVQRTLNQYFKPLPSLIREHPDLRTSLLIRIDATTGKVLSSSVSESSGIAAYDAAAERAVAAAAHLPVPPEALVASIENGFTVRLTPP